MTTPPSPYPRVAQADFETSAATFAQCPSPQEPEIAIAGRSNVGKSTLLNHIAQVGGLARTSRTPGRTQLLNFFRLAVQVNAETRLNLRIVDLPGYGYAKVPESVRRQFGPMIEQYLSRREVLRGLLLLIDARRGFADQDLELLGFMSELGRPTLIVATKVDQLGATERGLLAKRMAQSVGARPRDIVLTSAHTGLGLQPHGKHRGILQDIVNLSIKSDS